MKGDALQPTHAKWRKSVLVLQAAELTLYGDPSPIQIAEPLRLSRDQRRCTAPVRWNQGELLRLACPERNDGVDAARLALGLDALSV